MTDRAVILAAGLGTRMRAGGASGLSPEQAAAAARGFKAMIPVGRPFLDYILSGLADAGCRHVCLVVGASHEEISHYYRTHPPVRLTLAFAVQPRPLGTADAVLAAERFAGTESVLVLNGDNLYPSAALQALRELPRAGLLGFRRSTLINRGNIPAERIAAFALIEADAMGRLTRIVEKPDPEQAAEFGEDPLVSMNAWLLPPSVYFACRAIQPSLRGELELQDAVSYAIRRLTEPFRIIESEEGVLDLSTPGDIPVVLSQLREIAARP